MKVCYISPYPLRAISGVSKVVTELCKGLKKRNVDHLIITGRLKDEIGKDEVIEAIEIDVSKVKSFKGPFVAAKTVIMVLKHKKDIDLLHLHSPHLQPMLAAILGKMLGIPVVTTIHGIFSSPKSILRRLYLWITIKGTIAFSDNVTFVDAVARKHYKVPAGVIIENGVDPCFYSPNTDLREQTRTKLGLSEKDIVLLYVGRVVSSKGIYELLDAFSKVRTGPDDGLKLIIVGPGETNKVSSRIKSLEMENDVKFFGQTEEVIHFYNASDVFVLYSGFEGLPMVLLEAASCGLVLISTKVGGIPSLIKDGENGLLLRYGDKNGLVQKIKTAVRNEKLREHLSKNIRETIIERYSLDRTVDSYLGLYKSMLREKGI